MIERKNGSKGSVCVCVVRVAACVYEMDTESKREFWIVCVGEKTPIVVALPCFSMTGLWSVEVKWH